MAIKLGLTRDQLATFLKDPEQIKQFEKLFGTVQQTTTIILPAVDTSVGLANAQAAKAIGDVESFKTDASQSISAITSKINVLSASVVELSDRLDGIKEADNKGFIFAEIQQIKNEIDALKVTSAIRRPPKRRRIGCFLDTTTQTAAAINTPYAVTFNTTDQSDGVYIGTPSSRIYVDTEAIYNFQFSVQTDNTSGGSHLVFLWYRINGVDVANSASQVRLKGTDGELVAAWKFVAKLKADDYFELMWSVSDTSVQLTAQAAAAPVPGIPSALLSVITVE